MVIVLIIHILEKKKKNIFFRYKENNIITILKNILNNKKLPKDELEILNSIKLKNSIIFNIFVMVLQTKYSTYFGFTKMDQEYDIKQDIDYIKNKITNSAHIYFDQIKNIREKILIYYFNNNKKSSDTNINFMLNFKNNLFLNLMQYYEEENLFLLNNFSNEKTTDNQSSISSSNIIPNKSSISSSINDIEYIENLSDDNLNEYINIYNHYYNHYRIRIIEKEISDFFQKYENIIFNT